MDEYIEQNLFKLTACERSELRITQLPTSDYYCSIKQGQDVCAVYLTPENLRDLGRWIEQRQRVFHVL